MWIEISAGVYNSLKQLVTPLAGVWIEINTHMIFYSHNLVTPLAGVWIEILLTLLVNVVY